MEKIVYNEKTGCYEQDFDGHTVFARVRHNEGIAHIDYVEAPLELRGKGAAGKFMATLMETLKSQDLKAHPICGYAAGWLNSHDGYADMVVK